MSNENNEEYSDIVNKLNGRQDIEQSISAMNYLSNAQVDTKSFVSSSSPTASKTFEEDDDMLDDTTDYFGYLDDSNENNHDMISNNFDNEDFEYVDLTDFEICNDCLPIPGDEIIGTRSPDNEGYFATTIHRRGCSHTIPSSTNYNSNNINGNSNNILSNDNNKGIDTQDDDTVINGSSTTSSCNVNWSYQIQNQDLDSQEEQNHKPYKLKWGSIHSTFLVELIVTANDRKLLLADCSQVVSEKSEEILKTSSRSSKEHAILEYLVRVKDIKSLQKLMDYLTDVTSVMSVERRFGSKLIKE